MCASCRPRYQGPLSIDLLAAKECVDTHATTTMDDSRTPALEHAFSHSLPDCRRTHVPVHVFLSRPSWLLHECQRILSQPKDQLIEAPESLDDSLRTLDVLLLESLPQDVPDSATQPEEMERSVAQPAEM